MTTTALIADDSHALSSDSSTMLEDFMFDLLLSE